MRVAVWDDLPEGGAKRVVFEQVKGLSQFARVDYVTNRVESVFRFQDFASSVHRFEMGMEKHSGWMRPLQELSFVTKVLPAYRKAATLISQLHPDVVLVHPSMISQGPLILTMIKEPTVYYAHEWPRVVYEPKFHPLPAGFHAMYEFARRWLVKQIDLKSVRSAKAVVTTSTYLDSKLSKLYDLKIKLVAPGVELNTFFPKLTDKGEKSYFLFLGEKEAINGYPLLRLALEAGEVVKFVTFKGHGFRYSDDELADLYRGAVATLCLAEDEPFGLTAIESMACGTPVIAVDSGGYKDTVKHNQNGLLIQPDGLELLQAMKRLRLDSTFRNRMGKQARELVESTFSWDIHMGKLVKIFKEVI